jgi:hypothetical protein
MRKYFAYILLLLFTSCLGRKNITDYYEVTWGDYYTQGEEGYCIGCQLRGESDSLIVDVKGIKWNKKIIIVEKNSKEELRWYAFVANGDTLKCGNWDKLIGPFSQYQIDSLIDKGDYRNLKEDVFLR